MKHYLKMANLIIIYLIVFNTTASSSSIQDSEGYDTVIQMYTPSVEHSENIYDGFIKKDFNYLNINLNATFKNESVTKISNYLIIGILSNPNDSISPLSQGLANIQTNLTINTFYTETIKYEFHQSDLIGFFILSTLYNGDKLLYLPNNTNFNELAMIHMVFFVADSEQDISYRLQGMEKPIVSFSYLPGILSIVFLLKMKKKISKDKK
jgi:hypothetical protein